MGKFRVVLDNLADIACEVYGMVKKMNEMYIFTSDLQTPSHLLKLCPAHRVTPLLSLDQIASQLNISGLLAKDEGKRALGSFKSLGGSYAGLAALARAAGVDVQALFDLPATQKANLPRLICASDGNHGLAVAAAARLIGSSATIYLHTMVSRTRVDRIKAQGADVVIVEGNYDDAVTAAQRAAAGGYGLLVADTGDTVDDPVVADVMAGYGVMGDEIVTQLVAQHLPNPTHIFVQAGVGGLAAAVAQSLCGLLAAPAKLIIVEPDKAACVAPALLQKKAIQITGDLETSADMLSCGLASTPALEILLSHSAVALEVSETAIMEAANLLNQQPDISTTASGATGLAGLMKALSDPSLRQQFELGGASRPIIFITEKEPQA
jgi:diaminopropionate ammonia-lyase